MEKKLLPPIGSTVCLIEGRKEVEILEIDPLRRLLIYKEGESIKEDVLDKYLPKDFEKIARNYDCIGCECETPKEGDEIFTQNFGRDFVTFRRFY